MHVEVLLHLKPRWLGRMRAALTLTLKLKLLLLLHGAAAVAQAEIEAELDTEAEAEIADARCADFVADESLMKLKLLRLVHAEMTMPLTRKKQMLLLKMHVALLLTLVRHCC